MFYTKGPAPRWERGAGLWPCGLMGGRWPFKPEARVRFPPGLREFRVSSFETMAAPKVRANRNETTEAQRAQRDGKRRTNQSLIVECRNDGPPESPALWALCLCGDF